MEEKGDSVLLEIQMIVPFEYGNSHIAFSIYHWEDMRPLQSTLFMSCIPVCITSNHDVSCLQYLTVLQQA